MLQLPTWVLIVNALALPLIALIAAAIGFLQWRTAELKRKQDLYDKRYAFSAFRRWSTWVWTRSIIFIWRRYFPPSNWNTKAPRFKLSRIRMVHKAISKIPISEVIHDCEISTRSRSFFCEPIQQCSCRGPFIVIYWFSIVSYPLSTIYPTNHFWFPMIFLVPYLFLRLIIFSPLSSFFPSPPPFIQLFAKPNNTSDNQPCAYWYAAKFHIKDFHRPLPTGSAIHPYSLCVEQYLFLLTIIVISPVSQLRDFVLQL